MVYCAFNRDNRCLNDIHKEVCRLFCIQSLSVHRRTASSLTSFLCAAAVSRTQTSLCKSWGADGSHTGPGRNQISVPQSKCRQVYPRLDLKRTK